MDLKKLLIENNSVVLQASANNWKEAIRLAVSPLIKSGAVEEEYYDYIIENTEKNGPYYIIIPGVAMPHARPGIGVNRDCFSLITLKNPVSFGEDAQKISVLIALAATSIDNHNEFGIVQVADLFENDENVEKIKCAKEVEEILKLI